MGALDRCGTYYFSPDFQPLDRISTAWLVRRGRRTDDRASPYHQLGIQGHRRVGQFVTAVLLPPGSLLRSALWIDRWSGPNSLRAGDGSRNRDHLRLRPPVHRQSARLGGGRAADLLVPALLRI